MSWREAAQVGTTIDDAPVADLIGKVLVGVRRSPHEQRYRQSAYQGNRIPRVWPLDRPAAMSPLCPHRTLRLLELRHSRS
jgi:hypothetical protein